MCIREGKFLSSLLRFYCEQNLYPLWLLWLGIDIWFVKISLIWTKSHFLFTQDSGLCIGWFMFMVFNTTFNNISVISWRSVSLVEETRVPRENHRPVARPDKLYLIMLNRVSPWRVWTHNLSRDRQIAQVVANPATIRSWTRQPSFYKAKLGFPY